MYAPKTYSNTYSGQTVRAIQNFRPKTDDSFAYKGNVRVHKSKYFYYYRTDTIYYVHNI